MADATMYVRSWQTLQRAATQQPPKSQLMKTR